MADKLDVSPQALGATTASGTGESVDLLSDSEGEGAARKVLKLELDVRALTGTSPTIKVIVETAPDDAAWRTLREAAFSVAETRELVIGGCMRYVRARWVITGTTPSVTWSLLGQAHVVYCEPRDIETMAVPPAALEGIDEGARWNACLTASDDAEGYLNNACSMPLKSWDQNMRGKVAKMAAAELFRRRGCDPNGPDKIVFDAESAAIKWFDRFSAGRVSPPGIVDSTGVEVFEGGSYAVQRSESRGW